MRTNQLPIDASSRWPLPALLMNQTPRTAASYEQELAMRRNTEAELREILARDENLLRQKDEAIEYQALMRAESDHRLLNDMQIVVSLLSMQGRAAHNEETSA